MSITPRLQWTSAAASHIGSVREINEDAFLERAELGLWVVADGMGGHEAGDFASRMLVEELQNLPTKNSLTDRIASVNNSLQQTNCRLRKESASRYNGRTIGSTVVALLLHDNQGACLWAGDSRIYRWRDNQLQQLTRDHSHVQELVDHGVLSAEEAAHHPLSNVITRAVGSADTLEVDVVMEQPYEGDVYMLCSDGLSKAVSNDEISALLSARNSRDSVTKLIEAALANGSDDNITVAVVTIETSAATNAPDTADIPNTAQLP